MVMDDLGLSPRDGGEGVSASACLTLMIPLQRKHNTRNDDSHGKKRGYIERDICLPQKGSVGG